MTSRTHACLILVLLSPAFAFSVPSLFGQFLPPLQAETPEEYDAYLDVLDAAAPQARIEAARRFGEAWPRSHLLADIRQVQFEAYRKLGKPAEAVRAATQALALAPHNHSVRAGLSLILANEARTPSELDTAQREANATLDRLASFVPPRSLPYPTWEQITRRVEGQAHAALGLIAFKRDRTGEALREFETSVRLSPDPATHYRLGKLYQVLGRRQDARRSFEAASAGADPQVAALALRELQHDVR